MIAGGRSPGAPPRLRVRAPDRSPNGMLGGLFVATFLTLLFLPGLCALWFRKSLDERGTDETPAAVEHQPELPLPMAAE